MCNKRSIIAISFVLSLLLISLTGSAQNPEDLCPKGPIDLKQAGGTWFISIAGGEWKYVGQGWEIVEELIAGTPVELVFKQRRTFYYVGSALAATAGLGLFFYPTQLCTSDKETGVRCEGGLRAFLSPFLAAMGTYWLLKVDELAHLVAVRDYNEMWSLICKKE